MSVKPPLDCRQAALFTFVDKYYIRASLLFWCYLVHEMLFTDVVLSTKCYSQMWCYRQVCCLVGWKRIFVGFFYR
jgi:hypothetical protein